MSEEQCIWEDCDQKALYCEGHAQELVDPLGKLAEHDAQAARIRELEGEVTRLTLENQSFSVSSDGMREEIYALRAERDRLRGQVEQVRKAFYMSGEFDNFECEFGARLGKCPPSNECWACSMYLALSGETGGEVKSCPGCHMAIYDKAAVDGWCTDCNPSGETGASDD